MTDTKKPTLYLTNFANCHRFAGPGCRLSIMTWTPKWAESSGKVSALVPGKLFEQLRDGTLTLKGYRRQYKEELDRLQNEGAFDPGMLTFMGNDGTHTVKDGDTLCCTCSLEIAAKNQCHRSWVTEILSSAGWRCILDGQEV